MVETNRVIRTLGDVLSKVMAPSAGGSVPASSDEEYGQWVSWVQQKQEEYAVRGFWRMLLTREEITIEGDVTVLPDRFHKENGLYILDVNGIDYADENNPKVSVEMINDPEDEDYGKWQMRFDETQDLQNAVIWYFAAPPVPTVESDLILLPGDMVGFAALAEYFRTTGAEGSQDKAEADAENRFQEYISIQAIPDKSRLIKSTRPGVVNRTAYLKQFYYRPGRWHN